MSAQEIYEAARQQVLAHLLECETCKSGARRDCALGDQLLRRAAEAASEVMFPIPKKTGEPSS